MEREHRKLATARYRKGWSQERVAEAIGVTRSTLSQWERGRQTPQEFYVYRLCELYQTTREELGLEDLARCKPHLIMNELPPDETVTLRIETIGEPIPNKVDKSLVIPQEDIERARELSGEESSIISITLPVRLSQTVATDIFQYRKNIRVALHLHRTSTAQGLLGTVHADIQDLEHLERQTRSHDLYNVKELLIGNHLLATKIVKDQRQYTHAYSYANNAVRIAKSLEDGDLIATTKYTRGCVKFEWAQFGTIEQGILQLNKVQVREAIRDFQDVLILARAQRSPLHPQLQGFTHLQVSRAYSLLYNMRNNSPEMHPLILVDQAERTVNNDVLEDAYTRLIMTGTLSGLHWGAYHLNRAEVLIALGMQVQALTELKHLAQLTEQTYAHNEMRNQAWSNIIMAEVLMALKEYPKVTDILKSALVACQSINSAQNTAMILNIHRRLVNSSYGISAEVQEVGAMLREWYNIA